MKLYICFISVFLNLFSSLAFAEFPNALPGQESVPWGQWVKNQRRPDIDSEVSHSFLMTVMGHLEPFKPNQDNLSQMESLIYELNPKDLNNHEMVKLYKKSGLSYAEALIDIFPHIPLARWRLKPSPRNFWNKRENHLDFLRYVALKEGWTKWEDFLQIENEMVLRYGGKTLLNTHYKNTWDLLNHLMPGFTWYPWEMAGALPPGIWDDFNNQVIFLNYIAKHENWVTEDDYYNNFNSRVLKKYKGGKNLMDNYYGGSPFALLKAIRKDIQWDSRGFKQVPSGYWLDAQNIKALLLKIGNDKGWEFPQGYYNITTSILKDYGADRLGDAMSLQKLMEIAFPENTWYQWNFVGYPPKDFWVLEKNQKDFALYLKENLGWKTKEDCYNSVNRKLISYFHAHRLFSDVYKRSMDYLKHDLCNHWLSWE